MKKILLFLLVMAGFAGFSQHTFTTASTESVIVKSGSITVTGGSLTVSSATTAMVVSVTTATSSGTVTAGAQTVLFETSGDFSGSIHGATFLSNGFLPYPPVPDHTWPAIPYVVTTGTLYIRKAN